MLRLLEIAQMPSSRSLSSRLKPSCTLSLVRPISALGDLMTTSSTSWIYLAGPLFTQAEIGFNQIGWPTKDGGRSPTGVFWQQLSGTVWNNLVYRGWMDVLDELMLIQACFDSFASFSLWGHGLTLEAVEIWEWTCSPRVASTCCWPHPRLAWILTVQESPLKIEDFTPALLVLSSYPLPYRT